MGLGVQSLVPTEMLNDGTFSCDLACDLTHIGPIRDSGPKQLCTELSIVLQHVFTLRTKYDMYASR